MFIQFGLPALRGVFRPAGVGGAGSNSYLEFGYNAEQKTPLCEADVLALANGV